MSTEKHRAPWWRRWERPSLRGVAKGVLLMSPVVVVAVSWYGASLGDQLMRESYRDTCIDHLAAWTLHQHGLTDVEVRVNERRDDFAGRVSGARPTTIFLAPYAPAMCQDEVERDALAEVVLHEAAHVAQNRLLGMPENPVLATLALPWQTLQRARYDVATGGVRVNPDGRWVPAHEWIADCAVEAVGHPRSGDFGYGVECTDDDRANARALLEGRWPSR